MKHTLVTLLLILNFMVLHSQSPWEAPTKVADSLDLLLEFEAALPYRVEARALAESEPDSIRTMLNGLYLFTKAENDFNVTRQSDTTAYALMQRATDSLVAANATPERISKAYWDLNMAAFNYMRNREDTEKYLNKSIEYHLKSPEIDTLHLLNTMHGSGYMSILSGKYDAAIKTLEQAVELFEQYRVKEDTEHNLLGYLYSNLALVYNSGFLDIPQKERFYLEKAVAVYNAMEQPDYDYYLGALTNLSGNHRSVSNYKKARGYLNKAMQEYESNKERIHQEVMHHLGIKKELDFLGSLIILHRDGGDEAAMLEEFKKAEALVAHSKPDQIEMGVYKGIIESVVRYYTIFDPSPELAEKYIQKGLQIHTQSSAIYRDFGHEGLLRSRARVYLFQKEYTKALDVLKEIEHPDLTTGKKITLNELKALCYLGLDQPEEATKMINDLVGLLSEDNQGFMFTKSAVADFHPGSVLADSETLINLAQAWREFYGNYSSEEEQLYWMAKKQFEHTLGNNTLTKVLEDNFDLIQTGLLDAALERGFSIAESNELLSFIESVKSQSLINTFLLNRELAGNSELYKLVEEEQLIRSQITQLKKSLQDSEDKDFRQQLFDKNLELEALQKQLTDTYREFNDFATTQFRLEDYNGNSIIKFIAANENLYKLTISKGSVDYEKVADFQSLKQTIADFARDISDPQVAVSELKGRGEQIFNQLFSNPLEIEAAPILIPDGILHYLPFELLVKDGRYLIEDHSIAYAPNLTFININNLKSSTSRSNNAAFFAPEYSGVVNENQLVVRGNPYALQGAQDEVNEISRLLPGKLFTGDAASKSTFKQLENNFAIIHLAMHSNLNDNDPELSSLLFTDTEADYEMYISELYGMNFNSDLAVLSACNTGIGGFKDGGGLVSFQNAFTLAGIPATVASLWSAPDQSTKEIMVSFYKHLKEGHSKSKSLQLAKLEYIKNSPSTELQHPFYWAGFVLSGNDLPLNLSQPVWQRPVVQVIGGLLLVLLLVFAVFKKRRRG